MKRPRHLLVLWVALAGPAFAHDFTITKVDLLLRADATYQVDLTCDLDALALGRPQSDPADQLAAAIQAMSREDFEKTRERLAEFLVRHTRIRFDNGARVRPEISFPDLGSATPAPATQPSIFGVTARFSGPIPPGAKSITFGASRSFQAVHLTIRREGDSNVTNHVLGVGDDSPPFELRGTSKQSVFSAAVEYTRLGFEHILPKGIDHILFVLSLFLLSPKLRPLLWQVTAFTLAHSVTLALSVLGVVRLDASIVEPLIALSIAFVAIENVATTKLHAWRPVVVFVFGLLHGLGFAGVLRELGLPEGQLATALVSFNVGVELGQLAVIGLALVAVGWFRQERWYRLRITLPVSFIIAVIGAYTALQRAFLSDSLPALI